MFTNFFNQKFDAHKAQAQAEQETILSKKAQEIFKDKPFNQEYKKVFFGANVIKYSTNLISFLTGFFACLYVLKLLIGYYAAFVVSCALCAVLELVKNSLWLSTVKNKLRYNKLSISLFFLVTISALSLGASCFGAYVMLDNFTQDKVLSYTKQDSIYISELAAINKQIEQAQEVTKNVSSGQNLTSSTNKRTSANLTKQVKALQTNKDSLTAKIEAINKRISSDQEQVQEVTKKKQASTRLYLVSISVLSELLYLISSVFVFYYLFRLYVDTNSLQPLNDKKTKNKRGINEELQAGQRPQIGYTQAPKNDIKYIVHNKKRYTQVGIKQNIAANKSKLNQALKNNDTAKIERYKTHLEKWQKYLNQVQ